MLDLTNFFKLLEDRGVAAEISKATGISSGNISDWKSGRSNPKPEALIKIAEALDCSVDYLLSRTDNPKLVDNITPIYRFPQYEQQAAAGIGQLGIDSSYKMKEYVIDNIPDNAVYSMKISGESMNYKNTSNLIHTGSIVLINPKFNEYELNNKIVIANFQGKVICKRCINKGSYILFKSDNPKWESENKKSSDDPNCKVLGVVLGVIENEKFIPVK